MFYPHPRCSTHFIGQNGSIGRQKTLDAMGFIDWSPPNLKHFYDSIIGRLVKNHFGMEKIGQCFFGNIIFGRAEAARHQYHIGSSKRFL